MTADTLIKKLFFTEILKGLKLTFKTMLTPPVTRRYPLEKRPVSPGFRGLHALAKNEEGNLKCVGCGLCGAYCPSKCIHIYTSEGEDNKKVVDRYEIDILRCVFCGFCVEACPFGAITLSEHYEYSGYTREEFYMTKEKLLDNWDKYFAGKKGIDYFENFWRPRTSDFGSYEGQAEFSRIKIKDRSKDAA